MLFVFSVHSPQVNVVIFTVGNEVAKVMFLHLSVIMFTRGGVCLSACWDTIPRAAPPDQRPPASRPPPRADTPQPGTPQTRHPSPRGLGRRLLFRTVRILLECILVSMYGILCGEAKKLLVQKPDSNLSATYKRLNILLWITHLKADFSWRITIA